MPLPTTAASSAREILVRLHDVMAARTPAQAKLDQVVQIIGEATSSEACSIYLLRKSVPELFAARGRVPNAGGWKHLGLNPPAGSQDGLFDG